MKHTLKIRHDVPNNALISDCSCGKQLGWIAAEIYEGNGGLPVLAHHQHQIIRAWHHHRPRPYIDPPAACTILLFGGSEDGTIITIPWQIYASGTLLVRTMVNPFHAAGGQPRPVLGAETHSYQRDLENPLKWSYHR